MNKEWGVKRVCLGCGARFYDFNKDPIICPACGEVFDPDYLQKRKEKAVADKEIGEALPDEDLIETDDNESDENEEVDLDESAN